MQFSPIILCVDDDEDDLLFIKDAIESQGHSFEMAGVKNGWEAINYLNNAAVNKVFPCLVIMDMNMPKMDGKQTLKKIKENSQFSKIPVVVFTTSTNAADKAYFEEQGVHYIVKPFEYKEFVKEITDVLTHCAEL